MDRSKEVKARTNSFAVAFFSLWFHLINFCLSGVGVTTNKEKVDYPNKAIVNTNKPSTSIVDLEETNRAKADRADKLGVDTTESVEVGWVDINRINTNKVDKPGTGIADLAKADRADKPCTGLADLTKANRMDKSGISISNLAETNRVDKLNIGIVAKN